MLITCIPGWRNRQCPPWRHMNCRRQIIPSLQHLQPKSHRLNYNLPRRNRYGTTVTVGPALQWEIKRVALLLYPGTQAQRAKLSLQRGIHQNAVNLEESGERNCLSCPPYQIRQHCTTTPAPLIPPLQGLSLNILNASPTGELQRPRKILQDALWKEIHMG